MWSSSRSLSARSVPGLCGAPYHYLKRAAHVPEERHRAVSRGVITATVHGFVRRAPVDIRVIDDDEARRFHPGFAHFDPRDGTRSFTFTFAAAGGRRNNCHGLDVLWRSPSGKRAVLERAVLVVSYFREPGTTVGPCVE